MRSLTYLPHIRWQMRLPAQKPVAHGQWLSGCAVLLHVQGTYQCTEYVPKLEDLYWLTVRRVPRHCFLDATAIEVFHTANHYRGVVDGLNLHAAVEGSA
jgi:hypothetical protein